jgi:hypothetical protein
MVISGAGSQAISHRLPVLVRADCQSHAGNSDGPADIELLESLDRVRGHDVFLRKATIAPPRFDHAETKRGRRRALFRYALLMQSGTHAGARIRSLRDVPAGASAVRARAPRNGPNGHNRRRLSRLVACTCRPRRCRAASVTPSNMRPPTSTAARIEVGPEDMLKDEWCLP